MSVDKLENLKTFAFLQSLPYRDGWAAHKNDMEIQTNPYNSKTQSNSFNQWNSGWNQRCEMYKYKPFEYELIDEAFTYVCDHPFAHRRNFYK